MPRLRPPYPAECGLWGRPTWSTTSKPTPWCRGSSATAPAAFARLGTEQSKGTKVFALAGKVARGGLIEVPMGITIRQIVEEIGGGVRRRTARSRPCRSAGPSGGCVPAELADTARGLRSPGRGRGHHGLRRAGGAGRQRLHGRHRPLFPPLHAGPIVRQVHVLPHRHAADAGYPRPHLHAAGPARATWKSWKNSARRSARAACAAWAGRRPTRC